MADTVVCTRCGWDPHVALLTEQGPVRALLHHYLAAHPGTYSPGYIYRVAKETPAK